MQLLEVDESVSGKDLAGQDLEVVAAQVQHLRLNVDLVGDGDLALAAALDPTLAWNGANEELLICIIILY